jgi:hypothetical protein
MEMPFSGAGMDGVVRVELAGNDGPAALGLARTFSKWTFAPGSHQHPLRP